MAWSQRRQEIIDSFEKFGSDDSILEIRNIKTERDEQNNTLLHLAAKNNDVDVIACLIKLGFDVNIKNNNNTVPLEHAVYFDSIEAAEFLMKAGANTELLFLNNEVGPLHFVAGNGSVEMLKFLINKLVIPGVCDINVKNSHGDPPLLYPILLYRDEIVKVLIETGCDVITEDSDGCTPLIRAIRYYKAGSSECYAVVKMLVDAGSDVNHRDNNSTSVLHDAAITDKDFRLIPLLLEKGADINAIQSDGSLPIESAILANNYLAVKGLIDAGCRLDWRDPNSNNTLLHHAMTFCKPKIVKLLLEKGASIHAVNNTDLEPFSFGVLHFCYAPIYYDKDSKSVFRDNLKCLKILLKHGADINRVNSDGITALTIALRFVDVDSSVIPFLLNNKAIVDFSNQTVYDAMNSSEKPEASRFLMKHVALCETLSHSNELIRYFYLDQVPMELKVFYRACKDELEQMKKIKVDDEFSLYDVLARKSIACCVRNEKAAEVFERINLKDFPIYVEETRRRFEKETRKQKRLDEARIGLSRLIKWDLNAFAVVYDNVLRYLPKNDLRTLSLI